MKTLKRNGEFRRIKDSNMNDFKIINNLIDLGWEYSSKKEWKENARPEIKEDTKKKGKKNKK